MKPVSDWWWGKFLPPFPSYQSFAFLGYWKIYTTYRSFLQYLRANLFLEWPESDQKSKAAMAWELSQTKRKRKVQSWPKSLSTWPSIEVIYTCKSSFKPLFSHHHETWAHQEWEWMSFSFRPGKGAWYPLSR